MRSISFHAEPCWKDCGEWTSQLCHSCPCSAVLLQVTSGKMQKVPHKQGEGREQGNPMMPFLFSLGQHPALVEVQRQLVQGEHLFVYLDDIHVVVEPERVRTVFTLVENALLAWGPGSASTRVKRRCWNQAKFNCSWVCRCWKGWQGLFWTNSHICKASKFKTHRLVHPDSVRAHMDRDMPRRPPCDTVWTGFHCSSLCCKRRELNPFHCACASTRANFSVRVVEPARYARAFCDIHDDR